MIKEYIIPTGKTKTILITLVAISVMVITPIILLAKDKPVAVLKPQAMPVDVAVIEEKPIRLWKTFSGHLTAVNYVEIRPQITGLITEVKFEDGQLVNEGDVLYIIDPRTHKATVDKAKADLIVAKNRFNLANKEFKRSENLINTKLISRQIYDERVSAKLVAESGVKIAESQLTEAEINLSHAYVKAPVSGRVSRTEITEGNLVASGSNAPLLTTIVSSKSIYADFEVDEQTYLDYVHDAPSQKDTSDNFPVELRLQADNLVFRGKIHSFDNRIDPASGTIRARAIFDNPQGKLLPGMYARLKIGSAREEKKIIVNERAIGTDQNRKFVYIVNKQNKTMYKEVQLGDSINGDRIIRSGLDVGDKVIVRGLIRIRPNMHVIPNVSAPTETSEEKS